MQQGLVWQPPLSRSLACTPLQADHTHKRDSDTYDIYLLPPGEDVETCTSWLRMRNRDGRYNLMFEEWVTDGPFVISPRITFEVRRLGGWVVCCTAGLNLRSSRITFEVRGCGAYLLHSSFF